MVGTQNTRSRLRETLKQEDSSLAERLPTVATPVPKEKVTPAPVTAGSAAAARPATRPARKPAAKAGDKTVVVTVAESATPPLEPAAVKPSKRAETEKRKAGKEKSEKEKSEKEKSEKEKSEKVARDSFSMPVGEHKRIKALRDALVKAGCEASKSEVLRAGVALLAGRGLGEIIQLISQLPKVPKGKRSKKR